MLNKKRKNKIIAVSALGVMALPITAAISCAPILGENSKRQIHHFGEQSTEVLSSQRVFDTNFTSGNAFGGKAFTTGITLPLLRTFVKGKDIPTYKREDPTSSTNFNVDISFEKDHSQTKEYNFDGASGLIDGNGHVYKTADDIKNLPNDLGKILTFKVDTNVHYVDYKNKKTKYTLKGKDFLYGLIRSLYASHELRGSGQVNGRDTSAFLPKFSDSDNKMFIDNDGQAMASELNFPNAYLLDLFGIDLEKTIKINETANDDEFKIEFVKTAKKAVVTGFFANTSMFSPQSSQKIDEMAKAWSLKTGQPLMLNPGIKYGIVNYGSNQAKGINFVGYKDIVSVAPYIFTKYDTLDEYVMTKNIHFKDQAWAKSDDNILSYHFHMLPSGGDPSARVLQRISNYNDGIEIILDPSVYNSPQFEQFKKDPKNSGYTYKRIVETGLSGGRTLSWDVTVNPEKILYNEKPAFNDLGYQMMYGVDNAEDIYKGGITSINGYFNENGQILRGVINNVINSYTLITEHTTASGKTVNRGILAQEQKLWDTSGENANSTLNLDNNNENFIFSRPTDSAIQKDLVDQYNSNIKNQKEAYKAPSVTYDYWKVQLNALASKVGATPEKPAIIPVQLWEYSDSANTPADEKIFKNIFATLNDLTDGKVNFVRPDTIRRSDFISGVQSGRSTMFHYIGWSPDYPLANSVYQGPFSLDSGTSAIMGALYHDFVTDPNAPYLPGVKSEITGNNLKSEFPILNKPTNELKILFDQISIDFIYSFMALKPAELKEKIKNQEIIDLLNEINNASSKPFFNVSTKEKDVRDIAKYYMDHALRYDTSGFKYSGSTISRRTKGSASAEIVVKPWVTTASSSGGAYILQDYRVSK